MKVSFVIALLVLNACGVSSGGVKTEQLPPGSVARLGAWELSSAQIETAQPWGASLVESWTDAARVALHMEESRPSATRAVARATLSRSLLQAWARSQLDRAPVTNEEIEAAAAKAWLEIRRPRSVRFGEVFLPVRLVESDERARQGMEQLRERSLSAESTVAFGELATAAANALGLDISMRMWPPVAADGRIVPVALGDNPNESVPQALVEAASALQEPADKSPVLGTKDGYHILIAHEIIPARVVPAADLPSVTKPLVAADRGAGALAELRRALRERNPVTLADNRSSLLQLVWRKR